MALAGRCPGFGWQSSSGSRPQRCYLEKCELWWDYTGVLLDYKGVLLDFKGVILDYKGAILDYTGVTLESDEVPIVWFSLQSGFLCRFPHGGLSSLGQLAYGLQRLHHPQLPHTAVWCCPYRPLGALYETIAQATGFMSGRAFCMVRLHHSPSHLRIPRYLQGSKYPSSRHLPQTWILIPATGTLPTLYLGPWDQAGARTAAQEPLSSK